MAAARRAAGWLCIARGARVLLVLVAGAFGRVFVPWFLRTSTERSGKFKESRSINT